MASYGGTTQKCKACEKTVYLVDELTVDNKVYHRACFRCHHCKSTLKLSNYSSFEGVLYCQPHFDQLFKLTGSLDKSFEGTPKTVRVDRSSDHGQSNTRVSSMFGGTQAKCITCKKTVYPLEKVGVDGDAYHKACFKCSYGGCHISPSNYVAHEHQLYCKHHAAQLFMAKGNFSQFDKQHEPDNNNGVTENTTELLKHRPSLKQTKQIHAQIIFRSLGESNNLTGALIRSYTAHGKLKSARKVFSKYPLLPPTFLWNLIIQAYSKTACNEESLYIFKNMLLVGGCHSLAAPDDYTFTFTITACSRHRTLMGFAQNCHTMVIKLGYNSDVCVGNALVNMYVVYSRTDTAQKVFDEMPQRDTITWTSLVKGYATGRKIHQAEELFAKMPERNEVSWAVMIAGYVNHNMYNDALRCFNNMLIDGNVHPNEAIYVSVLSACAHLGQLNQGKWIHFHIDKNNVPKTSNIATALIDMYAKCGKIDYAKHVFKQTNNRDLLTWTSLISGLSMHGHGTDALQLFTEMLTQKIKPDSITLVSILNACSHSGKLQEGILIFNNMEQEFGISPKLEHFGCLVDLLSRAGQLEDAFKAVKEMEMEPDGVIYRALLSACRLHGNVGLAERIIEYVGRKDGGGNLLISNLYASFGDWDNVWKIRECRMDKERDLSSIPGCSYIEIDGVVHEFIAGDKLHPRIKEINLKLNEVMRRISLETFVGDHSLC
ncbi:hypothetical protein LXL04_030697 [Taraxacum kok-saghyz]